MNPNRPTQSTMKKSKLITNLLIAVMVLPAALAQVAITEIMYAPNQTASETDSEWIELYNPDLAPVNLTGWKINGYAFDPYILGPEGYVVVARELVDEDDADTDSFQSVWGTDINAIDGYFTLSNTGGTITLTDKDGNTVDEAIYVSSIGGLKNGMSIEKTDQGWMESAEYGGTPGQGIYTSNQGSMSDEVLLSLTLDNSVPVVESISYDAENIYASVHDANGQDDLTSVSMKILDETVQMLKDAIGFKAALPKLEAGDYEATVYASDNFSTGSKTIQVTIESLASMNILQQALAFSNMKAGETKEATIDIQNTGNVGLSLEFAIVGDEAMQGLECYDSQWEDLAACSVEIPAGETKTVSLRLSIPEGTKAGDYSGKLQTTATVL